MAPWLIIKGFGLDDWIYKHLLQSLLITISYSAIVIYPLHKSLGLDWTGLDWTGLAPFSFSFYDWLPIYDWNTNIVSRRTHRKHIRCPPAIDICELHRKHIFIYCCTYSALHRNGNYPIVACVFVVAGMCLPSRCPATSLHVTIHFYTVYGVFHTLATLIFTV
jgi:hypothetical protein